jgi:Bacterial aa3 type cytochrome c oxidase subunit IV
MSGSLLEDRSVAEQSTHYEFSAVTAKDILPEHAREWSQFTRFVTWGIAAVVVVLLVLLLFFA